MSDRSESRSQHAPPDRGGREPALRRLSSPAFAVANVLLLAATVPHARHATAAGASRAPAGESDSLTHLNDVAVETAHRGDHEQALALLGRATACAPEGSAPRIMVDDPARRLSGRREFTRGLEAARAGDSAGAIRWLEKSRELAQDDSLRVRATRYLAELHRAQSAGSRPRGTQRK